MIIRRADQEAVDRYPKVPRYAIVNVELGSSSLHVGDLTFLPGSSVPYHYHDAGSEGARVLDRRQADGRTRRRHCYCSTRYQACFS